MTAVSVSLYVVVAFTALVTVICYEAVKYMITRYFEEEGVSDESEEIPPSPSPSSHEEPPNAQNIDSNHTNEMLVQVNRELLSQIQFIHVRLDSLADNVNARFDAVSSTTDQILILTHNIQNMSHNIQNLSLYLEHIAATTVMQTAAGPQHAGARGGGR
jgi:hypothetical protein